MRTRLAVAGGAALCVLIVACGSVPAGSGGRPQEDSSRSGAAGSRPAGQTAGHAPPTAAGNRKLAVAEARRLLSAVPLPAGSARLSSAPRELSGPGMGTPGTASFVDKTRSWRLALSYRAAVAWLARIRPKGLRPDGSDQAYGPSVQSQGESYAGPASAAWAQAELGLEVAPARDGRSVMRADGQVVWLDPVPVRDTVTGRRLRVLVSGRCPARDDGVVGVTNHDADLAHSLVPARRPAAGLECRYYGMNGHPFRLRSQRRLTAAAARKVAASMARVPLSHVLGGVTICPLDDESAELIALGYPGQPDVDLWVWLNGCGGVSNGYIVSG
jgi:hypothetical protein